MCWRRIWIFVLCCSRNGTTGTLVDLTDWEPDIVIFSFSLKPELFANTVAAIFHHGKCSAENQIKIMNNGWIGKGDGVGGALGSRPRISTSRSWELQFGCDSSQKRSRSVYLNEMLIINHMNEFEIQLGKGSTKKNVFFRALPEFPKPPPHDPNSGNLVLFFQKSKFKIWKSV